MPRTAVALLALLAAAPALAGEAPFPREGDRWLLDVRAPASGPKVRFARIRGEPDQRGGWATDVTCGVLDVRTGSETVTLHADGMAGRSRGGWLGGTYRDASQATGTGGFTVLEQDGLSAAVEMPSPCPTGRGDFSSGD